MHRTSWFLLALGTTAVVSAACGDPAEVDLGPPKVPADTEDDPVEPVEDTAVDQPTPAPDTAVDTATVTMAVEAFSRSMLFGYEPGTHQAFTVNGPNGDIPPGVYYTLGDEDVFSMGTGDYCSLWVVSHQPVSEALWSDEVDGRFSFQIEGTMAHIETDCGDLYADADIQLFVETFVTDQWHGGAIVLEHDGDVEDFIEDVIGVETDVYLPGGFYAYDDVDYDEDGWAPTAYGSGYQIDEAGDVVIVGAELVLIDAVDLIDAGGAPVRALYSFSEIYYYRIN